MKTRALLTAMAFALATSGALAQSEARPGPSMSSSDVHQILSAAGYTNIHDVEFDDGLWEADATAAHGREVDILIDPATGRIYPDDAASSLSPADIEAAVIAEGYTRVHDIKFDDGTWKAEAYRSDGREVDIRLDPEDASIILVELD